MTLYNYTKEAITRSPIGCPCVLANYANQKIAEGETCLFGVKWLLWLKRDNSLKAFKLILGKDWGPSKGFNNKGLLKMNTLTYPGRNIVNILRVETGKDGKLWGLLESLPVDKIPEGNVNYIDTPHLVHTVYSSGGKNGYYTITNAPKVPIVGPGERWVEMKWLVPINSQLPKKVIVVVDNVEVKDGTNKDSKIVAIRNMNDTLTITEVKLGYKGIWGRCENGWVALRYYDKNSTNWKI